MQGKEGKSGRELLLTAGVYQEAKNQEMLKNPTTMHMDTDNGH
jgi:hypothetical protein